MPERYSRSDKIHRRKVLHEVGQKNIGHAWFTQDKGEALKWLGNNFYAGELGEEGVLLGKLWEIRNRYKETGDWNKFIEEVRDFSDGLEGRVTSKGFERSVEIIRKFFSEP